MHSTTLFPAGVYKIEDPEEAPRQITENTPDEGDLVYPTTSAMADPNMWVHANLNILKNNLTAHPEPEEPEGAEDWDAEEEKKKIELADPYDPRLKPITADNKIRLNSSVQ